MYRLPYPQYKQEPCNGLWRSEDMSRINVIVQRDVLQHTVYGIGMIGKAQFIDLNEGAVAFSRPFTEDIRLCDEMLRKLRLIEEELVQEESLVDTIEVDINMGCSTDEMRHSVESFELDEIAERIDEKLTDLQAMVSNLKSFRRELNHDHEVRLLYRTLATLDLDGSPAPASSSSALASPSTTSYLEGLSRLHHVIGTVKASLGEDVRRLCYRVTRGNAVVMISEEHYFYDPETGEVSVPRALFTVFSTSRIMIDRLRKLIEALGATIHSFDDVIARGENLNSMPTLTPTDSETHNTLQPSSPNSASPTVQSQGGALMNAMAHTLHQKSELLSQWYGEHRIYKTYIRVERGVRVTMNLCTVSHQTATMSLWIPTKYIAALESVLEDAVLSSAGDVRSVMSFHPSQRHPPTYFETDWFTSTFQGIVDSYGMARYKEVNPGVFTIVTFPYLFGMMYGDIGHGILLFCVALYFIYKGRHWREESLNEIIQMLFGGRYLLLLMSLFAIYMGVLYNDFMGFSINLFPSGYKWGPVDASLANSKGELMPVQPNGLPSVKPNRVYAMGLDPAWAETENKLEFYNSVKMKCAVIVGVVQMFVGLFLSLNNYVYHRQWKRIYYLFIPEFVFLLCTFGYMCLLIIIKWCTTWENTHDAPSLLEVMTNFFLQPGHVSQPLFKGQAALQVVLLLVAFSMVPILLCAMPLYDYGRYKAWLEKKRHGLLSGSGVVVVNARDTPTPGPEGASLGESHSNETFAEEPTALLASSTTEDEDEEFEAFDLSELLIHYVIHTIEYVLSTVSNTASYLRLWALSLAHAQLSEVFFNFTIVKMLEMDHSGVAVGLGVLVWLAVTMAVLVGMEALSSFLHALRLHWVEFQNKFYLGDGRAFEPYDLRSL